MVSLLFVLGRYNQQQLWQTEIQKWFVLNKHRMDVLRQGPMKQFNKNQSNRYRNVNSNMIVTI